MTEATTLATRGGCCCSDAIRDGFAPGIEELSLPLRRFRSPGESDDVSRREVERKSMGVAVPSEERKPSKSAERRPEAISSSAARTGNSFAPIYNPEREVLFMLATVYVGSPADWLTILDTAANIVVAAVAIWAVLQAMRQGTAQRNEQRSADLKAEERRQLVKVIEMISEPWDEAMQFLSEAGSASLRNDRTALENTLVSHSGAMSDFGNTTTTALYVLASSRRSRFPVDATDLPLEEFRDLVNEALLAYHSLWQFIVNELPDPSRFGGDQRSSAAQEAQNKLRRAAANLIAFMNEPEEWNRSVTEVPIAQPPALDEAWPPSILRRPVP